MYNNSGWATSLNANNYLTADEHGVYSYTINGTSWNAMRLSMGEINDASIITVNEEIVSEEIYQWVDTGYSFVTDAYNTKLTTIEETVQTNSERITVIEESISWDGTDDSGAPSQVKESANTVVDAAISRDDTRIFRFIAIADAHHTDNDAAIVASSKELGQAVDEVLRQIGVDFVANLGDITWGSSKSDNATVLAEGKAFNKLVTNSLRGETQIWTEGNHETGMLTNSQIHSLLYSHNKGLIQDSDHWIEGYGYMDFPNQKVRIICLNTNQGPEDVICGMSNDQLKWFAEVALDMSGKTDWSVITMGHHPLSYSAVSLFRYAVETLKAFINGENFSFETNDKFTFGLDYSDKSCQYVGHFHGHAHTYTILPIQRYVSSGVYEEIGAWEICIPNACASRTDQYASTLEDGNYLKRYCVGGMDYNRPKVDGQRTAFTVVTVCLDSMIIYADDYGVGPTDYDRYVYYGEGEKVIYSVTNMLTNATNSNSAASVLEGDAYTATLTANTGYELDTVKITMGGTDVTNTVYSSGVISIPSVTGNIIITAVAKETPVEPVITNLMDMSQRTYVAMDTPQFIEPNQAHEMDYTKCYAAYSTGRRGSYPTGKITYTQDASNNSFTFKVSSGSGYGVEFPVDVQGDKEYALVATAPARFPTVHLIKYNTDTTVNAVSVIHDASYENGNTKTITFTPESGYLYSLLFVIKIVDEDIQLKNISLMEKI